jgi:hypothetical protein
MGAPQTVDSGQEYATRSSFAEDVFRQLFVPILPECAGASTDFRLFDLRRKKKSAFYVAFVCRLEKIIGKGAWCRGKLIPPAKVRQCLYCSL